MDSYLSTTNHVHGDCPVRALTSLCGSRLSPMFIFYCVTNVHTLGVVKQHRFTTSEFLWVRSLGGVWLDAALRVSLGGKPGVGWGCRSLLGLQVPFQAHS